MQNDYVKVPKEDLKKLLNGQEEKITVNFNGNKACVILPQQKYEYFIKKQKERMQQCAINPNELTKSQETLLKIAPKVSIFDDLNDEEILTTTRRVRFLRFKHNEALVRYRESGQEVYCILEGTFSVQVPMEGEGYAEVAIMKKGSIVGEIAPVVKQKRSASVIATSKTAVVLGFQMDFDNKKVSAGAYKKIYRNFVDILSEKVVQSNESK